jgi:hypothetical protein
MRILSLSLLLSLSLCPFTHVIRRLDAIIRLAAAARSWAISERCIKYLALLASKVLILAAADDDDAFYLFLQKHPPACIELLLWPPGLSRAHSTSLTIPLASPACTTAPSRTSCLDVLIALLAGSGHRWTRDLLASTSKILLRSFRPWPIYTSFPRLITHMQHAAGRSPT